MTQPLLTAAELRGLTRLTTDAVIGVTGVVEAMHARIASAPRLPLLSKDTPSIERTRGITGLVYRSVGGVTRMVGGGVDGLLRVLEPLLAGSDPLAPPREGREALLAALNGVVGDHLEATQNPLAIQMATHPALHAPGPPTPKPLVLIHGLCMNHLQWQRDGHDHGQALARDLGYTPVYLHYNTGLSIATNGRLLAAQLEHLVQAWPVPIDRLVLLGHSMGGLVARSALHHGMQTPLHRWTALVSDLVCLGSPHQGARLERAGHGIDLLLGAAPYAAPLARLGKVRSAGITDLRWGRIVDTPTSSGKRPCRATAMMPPTVRCHAVAGCLGPASSNLKAKLLGDGLVTVASALGHHPKPEQRVMFEPQRQAVVHDTGHLDLLSSGEVYGWLKAWLG